MARKRVSSPDILDTPSTSVYNFTSKQVASILELEPWRLQKFLNSPQYNLDKSDRLGDGTGSRRVFSNLDIYRLGLAAHLVNDGFGYRFVAAAIQQLERDDFIRIEEGKEVEVPSLVLFGKEESLQIRAVYEGETITALCNRIKHTSFYFLDVPAILAPITERITRVRNQSSEKRGKR